MKTRFLALGAPLLALVLGSVLLAGSETRTGKDKDKGEKKVRLYRASQLLGLGVRGNNKSDDNIAHVEDVVINLNNGHIAYYAVGYGQVVGFGGKLVAVAPSAMDLHADSNNRPQYFRVNMTKGDLEDAKTFDGNNWPERATVGGRKSGTKKEERTIKETKETGGTKETKETKETVIEETVSKKGGGKKMERSLTRVSALLNISVRNTNNDNLGSIFDLVLDTNNHKVVYAAVSHGGTAGVGGKLYAMPWNALEMKSLNLRPGSRVFVINATNEEFNDATGFTSGDVWPARPSAAFKSARPKSKD